MCERFITQTEERRKILWSSLSPDPSLRVEAQLSPGSCVFFYVDDRFSNNCVISISLVKVLGSRVGVTLRFSLCP